MENQHWIRGPFVIRNNRGAESDLGDLVTVTNLYQGKGGEVLAKDEPSTVFEFAGWVPSDTKRAIVDALNSGWKPEASR